MAIAAAFAVINTLVACSGSHERVAMPTATNVGAPPKPAAGLYDDFGIALFRRLAAARSAGNTIVSPTSAALALAIGLEGASGSTRDSLAAILGVAGVPPTELSRRNASLIEALGSAPDVTLTIADALWGAPDMPFDNAYLDRVRNDYHAQVTALDLTTPAAVAAMNAWVTRATAGKIIEITSEPLPKGTALVLTNAVYFKGDWSSAFHSAATAPRPFHLGDGGVASRALMQQTGEFQYAVGGDFRLLRLPYRGGRLAMYVVLADSGHSLDDVTTHLDANRFRQTLASAVPRQVSLMLPRMNLSCSEDLGPTVASLGAHDAFDRERASFGRMLASSTSDSRASRHVWIDRITQRATVDVNEEGTVAAAATAVEMDVDSTVTPIPFVVDHPFLFMIRDDTTGSLLFLGRVNDPAGACDGDAATATAGRTRAPSSHSTE